MCFGLHWTPLRARDCGCRYYTAVCFPQLFEHSSMREDMVERAIGVRINLGHHVSTSNPAVLLKNLMAQQESRILYATLNTLSRAFSRCYLAAFVFS